MELSNKCESPRTFLDEFFRQFSDDEFRDISFRSLELLQAECPELPGKLGGWVGGLVHGLTKWTSLGHRHVVLNSDLENIFGVSASTIRKRSEQIWQYIGEKLPDVLGDSFSLRDEANAICAFAFRNGYIEEIHASVDSDRRPRITDEEMRRLMIQASKKVEQILKQKQESPVEYECFIRDYNQKYCRGWVR
jgi:hypothetical protein